MNHTLTPWCHEPHEWDDHKSIAICSLKEGEVVAIIPPQQDHPLDDKDYANARFIVNAANCHDALVEQLEIAEEFMSGFEDDTDCNPNVAPKLAAIRKVIDWAQSALADPGAQSAQKSALEAFISTIENTGGVDKREDGSYTPTVDPEWDDLGLAYIAACKALAREPKTSLRTQWNAEHGEPS